MRRFLPILSAAVVAAGILAPIAAALRFTDDSYFVPTGVVGQPFRHEFHGDGGCGPGLPYQYRILSGELPPGLSLSKKGVVSGTPTQAGSWSAWIELSDEDPPSQSWCTPTKAQRQFTFNVLPALSIQQQSLQPTIVGRPYTFQLTAEGGGGQFWSIASGTLPPGITLSQSGLLSGVPTQVGDFQFVVKVTDGSIRADTETLVLRVVEELRATAGPVPPAEVGIALSQPLKLVATGGTGPYKWASAPGTTLPAGLLLNPPTGEVTGTPEAAGAFLLSFVVADANGFTATVQVPFSVRAKLAVKTKRLRAAKRGRAYRAPIRIAGGIAPVRWRIVEGGLPRGLSLNRLTGQIIGMPRQVGSFQVTVEARDRLGAVAQATLVLTVRP
ncbi:MAG: hypothetical protein C4305_01255 [Thermoleophilia bacterium]